MLAAAAASATAAATPAALLLYALTAWQQLVSSRATHRDFELAQAHTDDKTSPAEPAAKSTNQPHHIWEGGKAAQAVSVPSR